MSRILVIDDDKALCRSLEIQLKIAGHIAKSAHDATGGLSLAKDWNPDLILLDLSLSESSGLDVLRDLNGADQPIPVAMITGEQDMNATIEASKIGVVDYIRKPFTIEDVLSLLRDEKRNTLDDSRDDLIEISQISENPYEIVGADKAVIDILRQIGKLSKSRVTVLIEGESGTGKEFVARALHHASTPEAPFVAINCSAIVPTLLESELFGHKKGSFTGADRDKSGKLKLAQEGTVFLDEIGDLPLDLQAKLLRVLQEREFEPVGDTEPITFDARVVAATHHDIDNLVKEGKFREDLFYRLAVTRLVMPPLRDRLNDIPLLVTHLISRIGIQLHRPMRGITKAAIECLQTYPWPGNVRELENVLTRAVALADTDYLSDNDFILTIGNQNPANEKDNSEILSLKDMEKSHIQHVLMKTGWNITKTAELLELSPTTVRKKIDDYGLSHP